MSWTSAGNWPASQPRSSSPRRPPPKPLVLAGESRFPFCPVRFFKTLPFSFQTECALRELQLSLCRRKLEYSTAKKASKKRADIEEGDDEPMEEEEYEDDDPSHMSDEDFAFMKILNEEEERIEQLTRELDELNRDNSAALAEMEVCVGRSYHPVILIIQRFPVLSGGRATGYDASKESKGDGGPD